MKNCVGERIMGKPKACQETQLGAYRRESQSPNAAPAPPSSGEVCSFLGLANYSATYIHD